MCILGYFAAVVLAIIILGALILGLGSMRDVRRYLDIRRM
jgi:hypothetical protein